MISTSKHVSTGQLSGEVVREQVLRCFLELLDDGTDTGCIKAEINGAIVWALGAQPELGVRHCASTSLHWLR